jgi:N utilization substance protein A
VGACVGIKGARVQNIIRELRGEKIDIVEWNDDARGFAINALNPAKVSRVAIVNEKEKVMEVIVEDKQLSLAIGKRGQNVRLAARLLGWRIDIKSEDEKKREVQSQMDAAMATAETDVRVLEGIGEKTLKKLIAHGVTSLEKIVASPEAVIEVPGIGDKTAAKIVRSARERLGLATAGEVEAEAPDVEQVPMAATGEDDGEEEALLVGEGASGVTDGADRGDGSDATGGER